MKYPLNYEPLALHVMVIPPRTRSNTPHGTMQLRPGSGGSTSPESARCRLPGLLLRILNLKLSYHNPKNIYYLLYIPILVTLIKFLNSNPASSMIFSKLLLMSLRLLPLCGGGEHTPLYRYPASWFPGSCTQKEPWARCVESQ